MEEGEEGTKHDAVCIDNASNAAFISVDVVIIKGLVVLCRVYFLFYWPLCDIVLFCQKTKRWEDTIQVEDTLCTS